VYGIHCDDACSGAPGSPGPGPCSSLSSCTSCRSTRTCGRDRSQDFPEDLPIDHLIREALVTVEVRDVLIEVNYTLSWTIAHAAPFFCQRAGIAHHACFNSLAVLAGHRYFSLGFTRSTVLR